MTQEKSTYREEQKTAMTFFKFRLLVVFLSVTSAISAGCKQQAPSRPKGVPASAVWAGGVDGGAFFECAPSRQGEPNTCTVYNDRTGEVYMKGKFVLAGQSRGAKADELKYDSADGNRIYLEHDLVLSPLPQEKTHSPAKR